MLLASKSSAQKESVGRVMFEPTYIFAGIVSETTYPETFAGKA